MVDTPTNPMSSKLPDFIKGQLIELDAQLDATIAMGDGMIDVTEFEEKQKKGRAGLAAGAAAAGLGAGTLGGTYLHGRKVSGGNAKGRDAMRIGARDVSNKIGGKGEEVIDKIKNKAGEARFKGHYYAGAAHEKGKSMAKSAAGAIKKVVKKVKFDANQAVTDLSAELDDILNFETIDDATAKKPAQKSKSPMIAGTAVGLVTGAVAGHMGTKHAAQLAKAGGRGISIAKTGYKTGKSKMASIGKGIMGNMIRRGK